MKSKNIAIAGEITPSKTIIPIIEKLREMENECKLSFKINKIIGLYHGESSRDFLEPYCDETYSIGEGRRGKKNSAGKLAYLISKDILKSFNALKGKDIDLLITAGNAGDVRKAIVAANILNIPVLHIEQDIYNPIEVISQANLVTVPSIEYKEYLEKNYDLKNYDHTLFPDNWGYRSPEEAWQVVLETIPYFTSDTLIHGDYCLPNVMFNGWEFSSFIDVGNGGVGDRHVDLFWGAWTLWFNLHTDEYRDRFFDAYGRDMIDNDVLKIIEIAETFG